MNKVYFYGGAFNPMTNAHFQIIKNISKNMDNHDLLLIGITNHDYKKYYFDYQLRNKIVNANLQCTGINYKLLEQDKRTWKFLQTIPYQNITLVMGEDEWKDLKNYKWHYSKDILDFYNIEVIKRDDDISSTKVRQLLKNGSSLEVLKEYISGITYNLLKENNYVV